MFGGLYIYQKNRQPTHIPKTYADSTYTKNICRIHIYQKHMQTPHIPKTYAESTYIQKTYAAYTYTKNRFSTKTRVTELVTA